MGALLALVPSRDWFYGALIVALGITLVYERHEGKVHELAAIQASSQKLIAQTAAQTAELKAKATMAEQAYDKEVNSLGNVPPINVRVCRYAGSGAVVPSSGAAQPGATPTSAGASPLQSLPAGDPSSAGPDIGGMLGALAASADQVSATLREFQSRGR